MWELIGNIASICSIIALPIALWQIYKLNSKVKETEKAIKKVLDIKEHEKLSSIFEIIATQYSEINDLISQANKAGKSIQTVVKKCNAVNRQINLCIVEIPPQYANILSSFKGSVEHIERYIESDMQSNTELKEARDYLNNALQEMKQEQKMFESKTISMVANNND